MVTSRARRLGGATYEKSGRGTVADRAVAAGDVDDHLAGRRLGGANLDLGSRDETLVVEPVQEIPVVLREPDDGCARAGLEVGERRKLAVLGLLDRRVDGPAVRAAIGIFRAGVSIRSIMSSEKVSARTSACSWDSAPV